MQVEDNSVYQDAYSILKCIYGKDAEFREGQYEAIEAVVNNKRTLVVQKTGWGKSLVYFIATKIFRQRNKGLTLVVSPLLALMDNQREAAVNLGLRCECLNSSVDRSLRPEILNNITRGMIDLVLITPETLFKDDVQNALHGAKIGMFVVDEVHCISDWGHDFRLDYFRLKEVIHSLDDSVSVLGTTATANDRVVEDLKEQFGENVFVSRGHLLRNNLAIQILDMPNKVARYAWILENIPFLPGTGIIYCLTRRDCEDLAAFLTENHIPALAYYSGDEYKNQQALNKFVRNEIKVLVATVKLGMGFDKGDVAFVVHYQMPANIVAYYQQIGRAGRQIDKALIFLMSGREDEDIHNYFISKAFPGEMELRKVLGVIKECDNGVSKYSIYSKVNIGGDRLEKALMFLAHEGYIYKEGSKYFGIGKNFVYNGEYYDKIKQMRYREMRSMLDLKNVDECINRHIVNMLNDVTSDICGCCEKCIGKLRPVETKQVNQDLAAEFLHRRHLVIKPRKKWPTGFSRNGFFIKTPNQEGLCLAVYGDPGYGELVKIGKYKTHEFDDSLVDAAAEVLESVVQQNGVGYLTCVPSLRSKTLSIYAQKLAQKLGLQFLPLLVKTNSVPQKDNENSFYQCKNAFDSLAVAPGSKVPKKLILVDDMVDSRWTLTVCGYKLCQSGAEWIFPFALADSSRREGDGND